jgi:hypothetical protein
VDLHRLRAVDWFTGLFGAALIGLLWAPWYSQATRVVFISGGGRPRFTAFSHFESVNAWQALSVNDVIFLVVGLMAIGVAVATATQSTPAIPITSAVFTTLGGLLVTVLALYRLAFPPDLGPGPTHREIGVWLGVVAAIGLTVSAALTMRDERRAAPGTYKLDVTDLPAPRVSEEGGSA